MGSRLINFIRFVTKLTKSRETTARKDSTLISESSSKYAMLIESFLSKSVEHQWSHVNSYKNDALFNILVDFSKISLVAPQIDLIYLHFAYKINNWIPWTIKKNTF